MIKNLNYELRGSGERTIVFLHGWGLDGSVFDKLIGKFDEGTKILNLDFFSFGKSDKGEEWFDTYEYAYHIFLLINELDLKDVVLVGHSFGGRVAIILSSVFGINIHCVTLMASAGINRFNLKKNIKIYFYKITKFFVNKKLLPRKYLQKFGSADYKKLDTNDQKIFIRVVNQDLRYLLKKIKCNVILMWDKKDDITPYWICKKLYKGLSNRNIFLFNNGKHLFFIYNLSKVFLIIKQCINDNKYALSDNYS